MVQSGRKIKIRVFSMLDNVERNTGDYICEHLDIKQL